MLLGAPLVSVAAAIVWQGVPAPAPPAAPAASGANAAPVGPPPGSSANPAITAAPPTADPALTGAPPVSEDDALIDGRRRPGVLPPKLPDRVTQSNKGAVPAPPPEAFPTDQIALPDRWRLQKTLCGDANYLNAANFCHGVFDPYHQNALKGDRTIRTDKIPSWLPIRPRGDDWFVELSAISDTVFEPRSFPTPVSRQTNQRPSNDVFGRANSYVGVQTFLVGAALIKGSTAYKPPEIEYRVQLAFQESYAHVNERRILSVDPSKSPHRLDGFVGVQELFVDRHLRNVSDRYDFDSLRVGIQPFQADFRGFLFNDNQLGVRLFGNRDNNRYQYNLAGFWRLNKDTNSGLNIVTRKPRDDVVLFANLYAQDLPIPGLTSQVSATYNLNREANELEVDHNGFPVRPALLGNLRGRDYDIVYLGLSNDGHFGRVNLTSSLYYAIGSDRDSIFTGRKADVRAYFGAAELSYDIDWIRVRLSGLYASGDRHPYEKKETGFDSIFENPVFAGADTSYWIRQSIPFAGGGRAIGVNGRNGVLADLRSSKEEGQSNFNNPGTILAGVGADFDVLPQFRISANVNHLWFQTTQVLEALRQEGSIPRDIGWDLSAATVYRPSFIQGAVFRLSGAVLDPGKGFKDLFANSSRDKRYYSVLLNVILSY